MNNKNPANSQPAYLLRASLAVIALIGFCVIIGWHFRVRALVGIIPGAIPMQYNTALCFILLALSASALTIKERRAFRLFAAAGGGLVGLFGALVIFQYASGAALGIDTLFFYPWDRTLSADPGRMALTTAISFALSGFAVSLLTLDSRTLIFFVLAHTFPLSFGITSLLGYLFGITYVLPYHLGTQMAVHTAAAFTIYGGAMLFYAWRFIPRAEDGLPRWTPGVAVVMIPVFFVSFGSTLGDASLSARLAQILFALGGTLLLAFVLHKLSRARIIYKGLILISIPLLFVLGFVVLVSQQKRESEKAQNLALHSKEVIAQTHALSENLIDAQASVRGYVITLAENYLDPYRLALRRIPEEAEKLQTLTADNPPQTARVREMIAKAEQRLAALAEIEALARNGRQQEAAARIGGGTGKRLMDEFRDMKAEFLAEEARLDEMRRKSLQDSWQQLDWLLVAGASADFLLAAALAFLFAGGIGRRLRTLTENARALAEGKTLAEPLTGTDEVAALDQTFHQMAKALQKARDELEAKVAERTGELSEKNEMLRRQIAERQKAEEDLAAQRAFLRQVIDLNPSFIFAKNREGRFTLVNQAVAEAYGTTVENLLGKTDADFNADKEEVERFRRDDLEVIDRRIERFIPEERITDADGRVRWLQTAKRPIYDSDGKVTQVLGVATDITERKWVAEEIKKINESLERRVIERTAQLEAANEALREYADKIRDLYDNAPCGYHSVDAGGTFVQINETELRWLGYSREEVVGKMKFSDIITPESLETFKENFPKFKERGAAKDLEFEMVRKDGTRLCVLLNATAIKDEDGNYVSSRSTVFDITERKRADDRIKRLNESLERQAARLEAANQELEAFSYSVSHDLRAPLRAIDGFSRIFVEDYADKLDDEGRRVLDVIRANAQNMGQLIDDLLAFSRLGRKQIEPSKIDMNELARSVSGEIAPDSRAQIKIEKLPPAVGDRALLRQVLVNLVSNAVKYSGTKENAEVKIGGRSENNENIYFVEDNGVGFDMKYAGKLFGVFQRLHGAEEFEGTGVGLAIVQRVVNRHGGRVWAEAEVGRGATFYFSLPRGGFNYEEQTNGHQ